MSLPLQALYVWRSRVGDFLHYCQGVDRVMDIGDSSFGRRKLGYFLNLPLVPPHTINFGLTEWCNLRCGHCRTWRSGREEDELEGWEIRDVLRSIRRWAPLFISFAGGEPFLRYSALLTGVSAAAADGHRTHITTNGLLLTKRKAKELIGAGLTSISISIDGATEESNDAIRGRGSYRGALRALSVLSELKEEGYALQVSIAVVVMRQNISELRDFFSFLSSFSVDQVNFNPYVGDNSFTDGPRYHRDLFWLRTEDIPLLESVVEEFQEMIVQDVRAGRLPRIGTPEITLRLLPSYFRDGPRFRKGQCLAAQSYLYIKPNGDVDVCGKGPSYSSHRMNVRDRTIPEIWHSLAFFTTRLRTRTCRRQCLMLCFERAQESFPEFVAKVIS